MWPPVLGSGQRSLSCPEDGAEPKHTGAPDAAASAAFFIPVTDNLSRAAAKCRRSVSYSSVAGLGIPSAPDSAEAPASQRRTSHGSGGVTSASLRLSSPSSKFRTALADLVDRHNGRSEATHPTPASSGCSLFHRC